MSPSLNNASAERGEGQTSFVASESSILRGAYLHRRGENREDERVVAEFWRARGFNVAALEDPSERFSRLPDLQLSRDGKPWAYCEVKTVLRHSWTVRILHEDRPPEEHTELADAPVGQRIVGDLVTAVRQLNAGNSDHGLLNFVVLVNRDPEASLGILTQLLSERPAGPRRSLKARRAARLVEEVQGFRRSVDLCLWTDGLRDGELVVEGYLLFNPRLRDLVKEIPGLGSGKLVSVEPAA